MNTDRAIFTRLHGEPPLPTTAPIEGAEKMKRARQARDLGSLLSAAFDAAAPGTRVNVAAIMRGSGHD